MMAALEIAGSTFGIRLIRNMLDHFPGIAFPAAGGLSADIYEVPARPVSISEDLRFGVEEQREEFVEETFLAFFRQHPAKLPATGAEVGEPVVHVTVRLQPVFSQQSGLFP